MAGKGGEIVELVDDSPGFIELLTAYVAISDMLVEHRGIVTDETTDAARLRIRLSHALDRIIERDAA